MNITSYLWVLDIISCGLTLQFNESGPHTLSQVPCAFNPPHDQALRPQLSTGMDIFLTKEAIEIVKNHS